MSADVCSNWQWYVCNCETECPSDDLIGFAETVRSAHVENPILRSEEFRSECKECVGVTMPCDARRLADLVLAHPTTEGKS